MYTITEYKLSDDTVMQVLTHADKPSFMEVLANDPKRKKRARLIARTADRIERMGTAWAFESATLKWLSASISLCEMRVRGQVIRVMTYLSTQNTRPIYLFDFDGHQGKGTSIPPHIMEKAERLANETRRLIEKRMEP